MGPDSEGIYNYLEVVFMKINLGTGLAWGHEVFETVIETELKRYL